MISSPVQISPGIESTAVIFGISLLVGTIGIFLGARLVIDRDTSLVRAALTAGVGAIAWVLASVFLGWIPFLGPVLTLAVWIGVINWMYPDGWASAIAIAVVAWVVAIAIVFLLGVAGDIPAASIAASL
ncbi:MAG: hypothetical protein ACQETB_10150 [Halobacteriota archaeon]